MKMETQFFNKFSGNSETLCNPPLFEVYFSCCYWIILSKIKIKLFMSAILLDVVETLLFVLNVHVHLHDDCKCTSYTVFT